MSLINDALKRATQSRKEAPVIGAEPPPPLRPSDPSLQPSLWPFLGIPLALAVVLALAVIFFWRWFDQIKPQPTRVAARTVLPNPATAITATAPVTPQPARPEAPSLKITTKTVDAAIAETPTNATESATTSATSNTTAVVVEPTPPAPLKLQVIFYGSKNPSAVINGKRRFVGDRIGVARLVAIGAESVTIEVAGKTNELALP